MPPPLPTFSLQPRGPRSAAARQRPWTRAEIASLKGTYGSHTDEELAERFGRSVRQVRALAAELRLGKDKAFLYSLVGPRATHMPRWEAADVRLLRRWYATRSNLEIARALGRSVTSVVSKARLLGLRKSARRLRDMGRQNVSVRYAERAPLLGT